MKALLRRHVWRIAGVAGAGLVLSALAIAMTGIESPRALTSTAVAANAPTPGASASAAPSAKPTASAHPTASASATPATSIDATPAAASLDDANNTTSMVVGALLVAALATGLAGFALVRQPTDSDDSSLDIAG